MTVLLKAVRKELYLESSSLLLNGANPRVTDNEGFNTLDFIFCLNTENLTKTLASILEKEELSTLRKYYTDGRLAKLRKLPFNGVVSEWFDTHRDIHGLTENEQEIVINEILVG